MAANAAMFFSQQRNRRHRAIQPDSGFRIGPASRTVPPALLDCRPRPSYRVPMSLKINELCVNCDVCEPACPNQAISQGEVIYVIDPARCTECVGHYDEPQCVVVCPVECIDPDPEHPEDQGQLLAKLARLQAAS